MPRSRILLLARYGRRGASSRLRSYQYLPALRAAGFDVDVRPLFDDAYVERLYDGRGRDVLAVAGAYAGRLRRLLRARAHDLVWVEKELWPGVPSGLELGLVLRGVPLVVDYDDAIFHRYDAHPSALVRRLLGRKIDRVMAAASVVLAGSPYLAERARAAGARRVLELPTVVDARRYAVATTRPDGAPFTIGWIGTPRTARYLAPLAGVCGELARDLGARFVLVGAGPDALAGVPGVERPAWSEATEAAELARVDVGVMPLVDEPFERGKCGYKLIQFQACGKPVVASPVGVNTALVEPDVNGYLARDPAEWGAALRRLAADPALGARLGAAGRRRVEERSSLALTAPRMVALFGELLGRQPDPGAVTAASR